MVASNFTTTHKMLGEMLVESGKLSADDLDRALNLQEKSSERLGKLLVDLGTLAERDLLEALGKLFQLPTIDASQFPPIPPELKTLSSRFMRTGKFFPFDVRESELHVALADPLDHETQESIRLATGLRVVVYLASETDISDAIEKFFGTGTSSFARLVESFEQSEGATDIGNLEDAEHLRDLALEAPVIRVVNLLITRAVESRASDIHIEPMENELRIRVRIDGLMYPVESPPRQMSAAVISRVKLMAKLNIAERRLPQDGRIDKAGDVDFWAFQAS
jgi:general secretion pathway protein E